MTITKEEKEIIGAIYDKIIKEEYGCDPSKDNPCILKARVTKLYDDSKMRYLQVFVVGKWRVGLPVGCKGMPSNKKIQEAIRIVRINTGSTTKDESVSYYKLDFDFNKGTFGGKEIMLEFVIIENAC
jgi:hypothetical protein